MIATLLLFLILQAVNPLQMLREDPDRAGVCTHPYEFRECRETAAPKGYKPFYLSHYGRHGSRTEWGLSSYRDVEKVLEEARQEGFLSAKGDSLLSETRIVIRVHDGMNGHLTRLGEEEHRILADRLYARYPRIFYRSCRKGSDILVKFIYNDRERTLEGLSPVYGPYYRWEDIKTFCEAKMR